MLYKCRKWVVVVVLGLLVALLWLPGPVYGQATDTPTPTDTPTVTPTSTLYPPGLPDWSGGVPELLPTSSSMLGCPDWSFTDRPLSELDPRWRAECSSCLPYGIGGDPLATQASWDSMLPSVTPLVGDAYYLSNYVNRYFFFAHDEEISPLWKQWYTSFLPEGSFISGLTFGLRRVEGSTGFCKVRADGSLAAGLFSADYWFAGEGQYCFAPAAACAALAPASQHINNYRVIPPGREPVLSFYIGDYPTDCGSDAYVAEDIQWVMYGADEGFTATPTASVTPDPGLDYFKTCQGQLLLVHEGGTETYESRYGVRGLQEPYAEVVFGVFFYLVTNGLSVTPHEIEDTPELVSLFTADHESLGPLSTGMYCVGQAEACEAVKPENWPYTFIERDSLELFGEVPYIGWTLSGDEGVYMWMTGVRWIRYGDPDELDCEDDYYEETPTPTPTPFTPTGTGDVVFTGDIVTDASYGSASAVVSDGGHTIDVSLVIPAGNYRSWMGRFWMTVIGDVDKFTVEMTGDIPYNDYRTSCPQPGDWRPRFNPGNYSGSRVSIPGGWSFNFVPGAAGSYWFTAGTSNSARACPMSGFPGHTYNFRMEIVAVDDEPVMPPQTTPTPTPTITPSVAPTSEVTATPSLGEDVCEYPYFRDDEPVVGLPDDWYKDLLSPGGCQTVIPYIGLGDIPVFGAAFGDLYFPEFRICVTWVRFPSLNFLGFQISATLFLVPVFAWVIRELMKI